MSDVVSLLRDAHERAIHGFVGMGDCGLFKMAADEIERLRSLLGAVTPGQSVADIKEHLRSLPRSVSTTSTSYFKDAGPP